MSIQKLLVSTFRFIGVWGVSVALADGILVLLAIAALGSVVGVLWIRSCPWVSVPAYTTAQALAQIELGSLANDVHINVNRLGLEAIRTPDFRDHAPWEFIYRVKDDVERPRLASVYVDRCRNTHFRVDPYDDWR
jgi:hypothetical protein